MNYELWINSDLHPSSFLHLTSSFIHHPSAFLLLPSYIILHSTPSSHNLGKVLARCWQGLGKLKQAIWACQHLAIYLPATWEILAISLPKVFKHHPSAFLLLPSYIIHQPSSLSLRCQQERSDDSEFSKPAAMRQFVLDDIVSESRPPKYICSKYSTIISN